ncbi:unnamed protein product [Dracunculus medinensis]|uniref:TAP-C domain-containing protein n=1 Tax=Dracunculus medinensis TaxID=318479 RepID=A0A0N4U1F1_DRAME|nr:unnamed protein product [Dracunculus medinensis]
MKIEKYSLKTESNTSPSAIKMDPAADAICKRLDFVAHCKHPSLYQIVLRRCPETCGLCDQPGALGQCPDTSPICHIVVGFPDACKNERIAQACMKSCNITTCLPTLRELTPKELGLAGYESMQKLLIELFSHQSQMKPEWSRKCLMDLNWDCEEAYKAFLALRDKILSEAFQ